MGPNETLKTTLAIGVSLQTDYMTLLLKQTSTCLIEYGEDQLVPNDGFQLY